jgi:hypothetical protein
MAVLMLSNKKAGEKSCKSSHITTSSRFVVARVLRYSTSRAAFTRRVTQKHTHALRQPCNILHWDVSKVFFSNLRNEHGKRKRNKKETDGRKQVARVQLSREALTSMLPRGWSPRSEDEAQASILFYLARRMWPFATPPTPATQNNPERGRYFGYLLYPNPIQRRDNEKVQPTP